jgi:CTP:molybdopterin cytidylyltransferase MocA
MSVEAIVLAAGLSSRMIGFKPLLPLGDSTAIERLIDMFRGAGAGRVLVVCGHRAEDLMPVVRAAGAEAIFNQDYEQGMFSSVRAGVSALAPEAAAFLVLPADVMLVRTDTILRLIAQREAAPDKVLRPAFRGRRGHPPLIPAALGPEILDWDGEGGLAGFLAEHEGMAADVPVADENVLFDVDTDEDYREALMRLEGRSFPGSAASRPLKS